MARCTAPRGARRGARTRTTAGSGARWYRGGGAWVKAGWRVAAGALRTTACSGTSADRLPGDVALPDRRPRGMPFTVRVSPPRRHRRERPSEPTPPVHTRGSRLSDRHGVVRLPPRGVQAARWRSGGGELLASLGRTAPSSTRRTVLLQAEGAAQRRGRVRFLRARRARAGLARVGLVRARQWRRRPAHAPVDDRRLRGGRDRAGGRASRDHLPDDRAAGLLRRRGLDRAAGGLETPDGFGEVLRPDKRAWPDAVRSLPAPRSEVPGPLRGSGECPPRSSHRSLRPAHHRPAAARTALLPARGHGRL